MRGIFFTQIFPTATVTPSITKRLNQNTCCNTIFIIRSNIVATCIFYIIILFLAWYIPAGFLYGISICEGAFIMTIVGGTLNIAWYDENKIIHNRLRSYHEKNFNAFAGSCSRCFFGSVCCL